MVSLFGLKLGSDKRKKSQGGQKSGHPQRTKIDQNTLGEGQFFGRPPNGASYAVSIYSGETRPGSAQSHYKVTMTKSQPNKSLYSSDVHNLAAVSMYDLSQPPALSQKPSFASLKQPPNPVGMQFNNASMTSLGAPPPMLGSRPSTPSRQKAWVNPLDVHFVKAPSRAPSPLPYAQGSSLSQPQLAPAPAPRNPPSPPHSIKAVEADSRPVLNKSIMPVADVQPSFSRSYTTGTIGLKGTTPARAPDIYVPASMPSPPLSLPRLSDEKDADSRQNLWDDENESPYQEQAWQQEQPVIQNVKAKRETLAMNPSRRQSMTFNVEEHRTVALVRAPAPAPASYDQRRPKTSADSDMSRSGFPEPLHVSRRAQSPEKGPRPGPAVAWNQQQFQRPMGPPAAAVGAHGRPMRPDTRGVPRPAANEYGAYRRKESDDTVKSSSSYYYSPELNSTKTFDAFPVTAAAGTTSRTPASPVKETEEVPMHRRKEQIPDFRFPDWSTFAEDGKPKPQTVTVASRSSPPTPNMPTGNWPLPSRPFEAGSPTLPQLQQLPMARSESPFFIPSFSRPWTPDNMRPGTPVKTTEITITTALRHPPPKYAPPRTPTDYGIRSPVKMEFDYGQRFI